MADQSVKITNLDEGSISRVAFEMAIRISNAENGPVPIKRDAFLDLYSECHRAARGHRG